MYDIIGDIHGHARELKQLLRFMEYRERNGVWKHSTRTAIFVGDYIDRGPEIRETLQLVRQMTQAGNAIALMGNHEYNALAYHYRLPDGAYLRPHNEKHNKQHQATLDQFKNFQSEWQSCLEWFRTLPLFFDDPGLRAVHACWDEEHIRWLRNSNYHFMSEELLVASHQKGTKAHQVIEDVLKGKELAIPEAYAWNDKDGHLRTRNRIKWWRDRPGASWGACIFNCPPELHHQALPDDIAFISYPADAVPVFFGHYWLSDDVPFLQGPNIACLDYSIAKGGKLIAYRFHGERILKQDHFVVAS